MLAKRIKPKCMAFCYMCRKAFRRSGMWHYVKEEVHPRDLLKGYHKRGRDVVYVSCPRCD